MKKFASLVLIAAAGLAPVAASAADDSQSVRAASESALEVNAGAMLYAANGYRLAPIYRVTSEGNPQVILNGKLVTVPASTLSDVGGKVTTSLSKKELGRAK